MDAVLALENGMTFRGRAAGALGQAGGEVVFNTSMTGYQEVLTDPSYKGQLVTMTCPEIGNYGISHDDIESRGVQVSGFIIRNESPIASSWRADGTLSDYLADHHIVAISDIDTRALTRVLRSVGVMRGIIATGTPNPKELVEQARALPKMEGADLVRGVTCAEAFDWPGSSDVHSSQADGVAPSANEEAAMGVAEFVVTPGRRADRPLRVAAYDFGMK